VTNEMKWTILWYEHQSKIWMERAMESERLEKTGHACYAWKQIEMWNKFKEAASAAFDG
jgi:hypothetical protein